MWKSVEKFGRTLNLKYTRNVASISAEAKKPDGWLDAKPYESIPGPKPLPIIGNSWRNLVAAAFQMTDFSKVMGMMRTTYGDLIAMRKQYPVPDMLIIYDPKDIEMFIRNEGTWPVRENLACNTYYREVLRKDIFGTASGLLTTHGQEWHAVRSKVNPILLQPRVAKNYIKPIDAVSADFIKNMRLMAAESGELKDFLHELNKWAFESIGVIALDTRLGVLDEKSNEEAKLMVTYMVEIFKMSAVLDFSVYGYFSKKLNLPYWRKFVKYQDYFTNMALKYLDEAEERLKQTNDYGELPEHEKSAFEKFLKVDKKIAMVMTLDMLSAGIDTTGKISAAALYFLAKNPEKQEILRKEVMAVMPTPDTPITKEILEAIPYVRAVVKETGRLAPIAVVHTRSTTKELILNGYRIPKGVRVMAPTLYLSTLEEYYKRPMEFIPERWLKTTEGELSHKTASKFVTLPFGFGPRSCVGVRFANLELEIILTKIIRNFELSWRHKDMTFGTDLLYGIKDPLNIHVKPIDK